MAFVSFHDSYPYSSVVRTLLLKKRSLVFKLMFLLFQMFLRRANACPALESLSLISDFEWVRELVDFFDHISMQDDRCV